jgi:hypothetical protein
VSSNGKGQFLKSESDQPVARFDDENFSLVRNSGCYLIAASSNNLVKAGYAT